MQLFCFVFFFVFFTLISDCLVLSDRYKPGDFINDAARDEKFEIPETTTLLLVGGSGKSSLLSRIKSVFDDIWNPSAFDTARVLSK